MFLRVRLLREFRFNTKNINKTKFSGIEFLRCVKGCSFLNKIDNEEIRKESGIESITLEPRL